MMYRQKTTPNVSQSNVCQREKSTNKFVFFQNAKDNDITVKEKSLCTNPSLWSKDTLSSILTKRQRYITIGVGIFRKSVDRVIF